MSTIVTINSTDLITNSRADLNTNFSNLNTDKEEVSNKSTDTTMASNSDTLYPSQKAVKTYVDAGGNVNASTTAKGIVEEATQAEVNAGTAAGATGARLFVNPSTLRTVVTTGGTTTDMSSTTTTTIAHSLGVAPTLVKLTAVFSSTGISTSFAVYSASTQTSLYLYGDTGTGTNEGHGATFRISEQLGGYKEGVITVDATNISIAWTKTSTPSGTANIMWEAYK